MMRDTNLKVVSFISQCVCSTLSDKQCKNKEQIVQSCAIRLEQCLSFPLSTQVTLTWQMMPVPLFLHSSEKSQHMLLPYSAGFLREICSHIAREIFSLVQIFFSLSYPVMKLFQLQLEFNNHPKKHDLNYFY